MTTQPVIDELIELRGLRFHYRDWAPGRVGASDLVLLHGFTGHARGWDTFAAAMTDRYRVLALDQRGHGETAWASIDRYGVSEMVEDLAAFVAALGLKRFSLLGLSLGGMVAIKYAGRWSERLAALVIVDIGPEIVASGLAQIEDRVRAADMFDSKEQAFVAARAANTLPPEAEHRQRVEQNLMRTSDGRWTWRYDRVLRPPDNVRPSDDPEVLWRACANIAAPTLIVRGELSNILSPEVAARMLEVIPDAHLTSVENAGHPVPMDAPAGFLTAARAFLKG